MLIGSLLRFSSQNDETQDDNYGNDDDLMSKALSKKLASLSDKAASQAVSDADAQYPGFDELSKIARDVLLNEDLETDKVRPFFRDMVEIYLDRFQVFPFDAVSALFSYLESREYPEQELRELVNRLEKLYIKQYGSSMRESELLSARSESVNGILDDEIGELRETLKYAAIAGERYDSDE